MVRPRRPEHGRRMTPEPESLSWNIGQGRSLTRMHVFLARFRTTHCRSLTLAVTVVFALLTASYGQTPTESDATSGDPCLAEPTLERDVPTANDQELTEKLDHCNGVLKPPPTEDQDIEAQPPEIGKTPVIPPTALPEQQPAPEELQ